ncbi:cytochrome P450 [Nemania abortiva]|nr:cytochrome P450 [Nemania abortiva]
MLIELASSLSIRDILLSSVLFIVVVWALLNSMAWFAKRPRNISLVGNGIICGRWLSVLDYILNANSIIMEAYQKSGGRLFTIIALRNYQVLISSPEHIREVGQAPEHVLSFNAAIKDRLEHSAIMLGFRHDDEFDLDGAVTVRAVKILLRESLPNLAAVVKQRFVESFATHLDQPLSTQNYTTVSVLAFTKAVLVRPCTQILYGDELAVDSEFNRVVLGYWWDSAYGSAICELLPKSIAALIGSCFMAWRGSMAELGKRLEVLVQERLAVAEDARGDNYTDLAQFVIQASRSPGQRNPTRLRQILIAMTFVFAHQPPMVLIKLAKNPKYIELLRNEIAAAKRHGHGDMLNHLPLIESVFRESCRIHPLDSLTVQRKVMKRFVFSDGTVLPVGTLIAVPQQAMMQDARYYSDPHEFIPERFNGRSSSGDVVHKWTDVNHEFVFWGSRAKPCPGRWTASHLLKEFLVHFLERYDFVRVNPDDCESVRWTTAVVPKDGVKIKIWRRKTNGDKIRDPR